MSFALIIFFSNLLLIVLDTLVLDPTPDSFFVQFNAHFWVVILMSLLMALFSYNLAWQLLKPLNTLHQQLTALNHRQLKSEEFAETNNEDWEIKVLRSSFRELLGKIERDQKQRETFISTLVHDLKTPLLAQGYLLEMVLKNDRLSREERIEIVDQLSKENSHINDLLRKIIDTYRLEYQEIPLNKQVTALTDVVKNVLQQSQYSLKQRQLEIVTRVSDIYLFVDKNEVERALNNLFSNALRYAKTRVILEISAVGISIEDDGPGLAAPLEELAVPFNSQPVMIAGERYEAGAGGLGLYIAKAIAKAHGGDLIHQPTPQGLKLLLRLVP